MVRCTSLQDATKGRCSFVAYRIDGTYDCILAVKRKNKVDIPFIPTLWSLRLCFQKMSCSMSLLWIYPFFGCLSMKRRPKCFAISRAKPRHNAPTQKSRYKILLSNLKYILRTDRKYYFIARGTAILWLSADLHYSFRIWTSPVANTPISTNFNDRSSSGSSRWHPVQTFLDSENDNRVLDLTPLLYTTLVARLALFL